MRSIKCILLKAVTALNVVMIGVMAFGADHIGVVERMEDLLLFIVAAIVSVHLVTTVCSIKDGG